MDNGTYELYSPYAPAMQIFQNAFDYPKNAFTSPLLQHCRRTQIRSRRR
jgi:hypothetical protein